MSTYGWSSIWSKVVGGSVHVVTILALGWSESSVVEVSVVALSEATSWSKQHHGVALARYNSSLHFVFSNNNYYFYDL